MHRGEGRKNEGRERQYRWLCWGPWAHTFIFSVFTSSRQCLVKDNTWWLTAFRNQDIQSKRVKVWLSRIPLAGSEFWFAYCKSEAPWCHSCRPCFFLGGCCWRRMGGWPCCLQGLLPCVRSRRPRKLLIVPASGFELCRVCAGFCFSPAQRSDAPLGPSAFPFLLLKVLWDGRFSRSGAWSDDSHTLSGKLTHVKTTFNSCPNN